MTTATPAPAIGDMLEGIVEHNRKTVEAMERRLKPHRTLKRVKSIRGDKDTAYAQIEEKVRSLPEEELERMGEMSNGELLDAVEEMVDQVEEDEDEREHLVQRLKTIRVTKDDTYTKMVKKLKALSDADVEHMGEMSNGQFLDAVERLVEGGSIFEEESGETEEGSTTNSESTKATATSTKSNKAASKQTSAKKQ